MRIVFILFISIYIANCGFHVNNKENNINAKIENDDDFARILKTKFNKKYPAKLTIKINKITNTNRTLSYKNNAINDYALSTEINISIFENDNFILQQIFKNNRNLKYINSQVNKLQDKENYKTMYNEIANRLLTKLKRIKYVN